MFGQTFEPTFRRVMGGTAAITAAPWWLSGGVAAANCVAAYAAKGAASLAASYVNLANPGTYDLSPVVNPPTWDTVNGWLGQMWPANVYLTTNGIVPASDYTWSMLVRVSGVTGNSGVPIGSRISTFRFYLWPYDGSSYLYGYGGYLKIDGMVSSGVMGLAGNKGYLNGIAESGTIAGGSGVNNQVMYILAYNNAGSVDQRFSGYVQAAAIYNVTLSAAQMLAISTAMAAL
jgi:hypothetical protein